MLISAGRVGGAAPAAGAGDLALGFRQFAVQQIAASDPQPVTHRMQRKQILRTHLDAIAACRAPRFAHHRQPVRIHLDRVEIRRRARNPPGPGIPNCILCRRPKPAPPPGRIPSPRIAPDAGRHAPRRRTPAGRRAFLLFRHRLSITRQSPGCLRECSPCISRARFRHPRLSRRTCGNRYSRMPRNSRAAAALPLLQCADPHKRKASCRRRPVRRLRARPCPPISAAAMRYSTIVRTTQLACAKSPSRGVLLTQEKIVNPTPGRQQAHHQR